MIMTSKHDSRPDHIVPHYKTVKYSNSMFTALEINISVYQHLSAVREIPSLEKDCVWIPLLKIPLLIDAIKCMANS